MASTLSHARAALITFVVVGAIAVAVSPEFRDTSLAQVSSGAAQASGATAGFHTAVDAATTRLGERLSAAAAPAPTP